MSIQELSIVETPKIEPYDELIRSIPINERREVIAELDNHLIIERAKLLCEEFSANKMVGLDLRESRTLFLAALRNLRDKKISVNQLATIHILDSAIRTLYTNPMVYLIHKYVNASAKLARTYNFFAVKNLKGLPTSVKRYSYNALVLPKDNISVADLPWRMQKPLMQRFFNFNKAEWDKFCSEMAEASFSEQFFHVLVAPEEGCWSSIIANIQKVLKCMRVLDWLVETKEGELTLEKIMLVPSFSMFQAAINAKAHTLGRKPVEFIPTYGYIEAGHYAYLKSLGKFAMALYLPEKNTTDSYQNDKGGFRTNIDGHPVETAFAGAIHEVYHAMREIAMSENVAQARMRLAFIAKHHPQNKLNPQSRPVDDILVDGELIYSYPPEVDTMFDAEYRSSHAESFGDLFYHFPLKSALHEDLKRAFIEDMVVNKEEWQRQYHLAKSDLRAEEQKLFDEIECQQLKEMKNKKDVVVGLDDIENTLQSFLAVTNNFPKIEILYHAERALKAQVLPYVNYDAQLADKVPTFLTEISKLYKSLKHTEQKIQIKKFLVQLTALHQEARQLQAEINLLKRTRSKVKNIPYEDVKHHHEELTKELEAKRISIQSKAEALKEKMIQMKDIFNHPEERDSWQTVIDIGMIILGGLIALLGISLMFIPPVGGAIMVAGALTAEGGAVIGGVGVWSFFKRPKVSPHLSDHTQAIIKHCESKGTSACRDIETFNPNSQADGLEDRIYPFVF